MVRRRKRQSSAVLLTTTCEPRFILLGSADEAILIWLCPMGEVQPSPQAQQLLCSYLFEVGVVSRCKLPLEMDFVVPPTVPPLPSVE